MKDILPGTVGNQTIYQVCIASNIDFDAFEARTMIFFIIVFFQLLCDCGTNLIHSITDFTVFKLRYCQNNLKPKEIGQQKLCMLCHGRSVACVSVHVFSHGVIESSKCGCGHHTEDILCIISLDVIITLPNELYVMVK